MTDSAPADTPVAIDRVDFTRVDRDGVDLRLTGRWLEEAAPGATEPLLVIQIQGRRHRFAAAPDGHPLPPDVWQATFRIPPWAHPRHEGQAALWVGTTVVPVPLPWVSSDGAHHSRSRAALSDARAWPPDVAPPPADADRSQLSEGVDPAVDTGRTGPLAELLFKESVSALHAELEQRAGEVARLQRSLADAVSELEARSYRQAALESADGDLRAELQELMSAVAAQRDDFERRLAAADERAMSAEAERERVRGELDAERERHRGELEAVRAATAAQLEDLSAARDAAWADAAELRQRLASAASGRQHHAADLSALRDQLAAAQLSRDAAAGEVAALRAELDRLGSELAVTREHQSAQSADLDEAQRLLAEARSLSEQLRSQSPH